MAIGKKMGSIKTLKESLKKGGTGTFIKFIPKDGSMNVRFLEDPEEWVNYNEHYDSVLRKSYPCVEDGCPGCASDARRTSRYLANALDVESDRVVPLQMPKTLVSSLVAMYDRMTTLLDRDFELIRSGEGMDTTYNAIPDAPMPRKMTKYQPHDLEKVLDDAYASVFNQHGGTAVDDDDDDEDVDVAPTPSPIKPRKKSAAVQSTIEADEDDKPKKKSKKKDEPVFTPDVPEDDDEPVVDEDDDDDGDAEYITEADLVGKPLGELRAIARDYGIVTKGLSESELIEAILSPEDDDGDE